MKLLLAPALAVALAVTHTAQAQDGTDDDMQRGLSLMQEGTRLLMQAIIAELGPAWAELQTLMGNLSAYYPPEVLPNGDIIIRRKIPLVPEEPDQEL